MKKSEALECKTQYPEYEMLNQDGHYYLVHPVTKIKFSQKDMFIKHAGAPAMTGENIEPAVTVSTETEETATPVPVQEKKKSPKADSKDTLIKGERDLCEALEISWKEYVKIFWNEYYVKEIVNPENLLFKLFPDHQKGQRWSFTPEQVKLIKEKIATK